MRAALDENPASADFESILVAEKSGWMLMRASGDGPHADLFDMYPYATTSPVYIEMDDGGIRSHVNARFFLRRIEGVREAAAKHEACNSAAERDAILANIDTAADFFSAQVRKDREPSE